MRDLLFLRIKKSGEGKPLDLENLVSFCEEILSGTPKALIYCEFFSCREELCLAYDRIMSNIIAFKAETNLDSHLEISFGDLEIELNETQIKNLAEFINKSVVKSSKFGLKILSKEITSDWNIATHTISFILMLIRDYLYLFDSIPSEEDIIREIFKNPCASLSEDVILTAFYAFLLEYMYTTPTNYGTNYYTGPASYCSKQILGNYVHFLSFVEKHHDEIKPYIEDCNTDFIHFLSRSYQWQQLQKPKVT